MARFAPGTTGSLKPVGGPKTKFRVLEVSEPRGFTDVSSLPLAKMYFQHEIEPGTDGTRFTHHITISGPLSSLSARVIGKKIAASLPGAMRQLGELAVQPR